jgi:hypothetical protein
MRRWYSPRGARRGLILAGVNAALWIVWTVGYTQGATTAPKSSASPTTTSTPVNVVACCLRQLDT